MCASRASVGEDFIAPRIALAAVLCILPSLLTMPIDPTPLLFCTTFHQGEPYISSIGESGDSNA